MTKLLGECVPLGEYSWFIDKIREYQKNMEFTVSLDEIADDFLIKPFLIGPEQRPKLCVN